MKFHLFDVIGVELEYMIVQAKDLSIAPIADQIFYRRSGSYDGEVVCGPISWSNELVAHVVELKTSHPVNNLTGLHQEFHKNILEINRILENENCRLLPTACHPFMDPFSETHIWPHDYHEIYNLYNRIFDCHGHGWGNLQSTHINLPFSGDAEFARLHAAIRLILPVIPGLCASSPVLDGLYTGYHDARMYYYQYNQAAIPHITGKVIPEAIFDYDHYNREIFEPINSALRPYDTDGILDHHFVNSRGAIARFDRGSIEIRVMDIQECPRADLGLIGFLVTVLKALVHEEWGSFQNQTQWHEDDLFPLFQAAVKQGEYAPIVNQKYLEAFGITGRTDVTIREFWSTLYGKLKDRIMPEERFVVEHILSHGTLATRILQALKEDYSRANIDNIYLSLGDCLANNQLFNTSSHSL